MFTVKELGHIVLSEAGVDACRAGYDTTDLALVGWFALAYGDINEDGTLN